MIDLSGKTIVITGGTRGLGFEIAKAVLQHGGKVFISSRSQSAVDAALTQLDNPQHAAGIAADVTNMQQVRTLSLAAIATFGNYQVWINNAAISAPYGPTMQIDPALFTAVLNTNIHGAYHGSQVAMSYFLKQGQGKLINLVGQNFKKPQPFQNALNASKAWLRSFTLSLAAEINNPAIGVFTFNPGMMPTDLLMDVKVIAGFEERLKVFPTIIRLLARPPEVAAEKAAWIASSATDGKSGQQYSTHSNTYLLKSGLKELWQKVTHQSVAEINLHIHPIPPYNES